MAQPIITGTWIDVVHLNPRDGVYWNRKTLAYTEAEWHTLVRHLKRDLGIELLMIQNIAKDGGAVYPSKVEKWQWETVHCTDPVGAILRACSAEGVAFYMGPGAPLAHNLGGPASHSDDEYRWYCAVSDELLERYGGETAFAGWYTTHEMSVRKGSYDLAEARSMRRLVDLWKSRTPRLPVIASPYFLAGDCRMLVSDDNVRAVEASGLDAIAYQDGIGVATARNLETRPGPENNARLFADLAAVHQRTACRLWANTELFGFENDIFFQPLIPGPFERIRVQLQGAAPHVERVVAYTVPGIMTSQTVCPGLGVPETDRLYWAYRGYLDGLGTPA